MADVPFKIGLAAGVQTARGTVNAAIKALLASGGSGGSSEITEADGAVLGVRDAGVGNSGINAPTFERVFAQKADLGFTKQPSDFQRIDLTGLQVTIPKKGNGSTWDGVAAGAAQPAAGIDALLRGGGLVGANGGAAPEYVYTPASAQEYLSLLLLLADDVTNTALGWVLQDCTVELTSTHPPGEGAQIQCAINVGSIESFQETTWWSFDYGNQASLQTPVVQGVGFAWGQTRDFASMEIAVSHAFEDAPRSNSATGVVPERQERNITASGLVLLDDADLDFEYQQAILAAAPTSLLSFQVGTPAASNGDTINAYKEELTNPETRSAAYQPSVGKAAAQVELQAVDETEDGEYTLTFL